MKYPLLYFSLVHENVLDFTNSIQGYFFQTKIHLDELKSACVPVSFVPDEFPDTQMYMI